MLKTHDILSCKLYSAAKEMLCFLKDVCDEHNRLYNLFSYTLGAINILPNTTMEDSNHSYNNYYVIDNLLVAGFAI